MRKTAHSLKFVFLVGRAWRGLEAWKPPERTISARTACTARTARQRNGLCTSALRPFDHHRCTAPILSSSLHQRPSFQVFLPLSSLAALLPRSSLLSSSLRSSLSQRPCFIVCNTTRHCPPQLSFALSLTRLLLSHPLLLTFSPPRPPRTSTSVTVASSSRYSTLSLRNVTFLVYPIQSTA